LSGTIRLTDIVVIVATIYSAPFAVVWWLITS